MPIATTGEQRALRDSVDAAKGEWADLVRVGFFEVTREGGTVADLAVMLERAAENLVPGPLLPTALVSVLQPGFEGVAGFGFSSQHVVGAAEATHLLVRTDSWMLVPAADVTVTPLDAVDLSRSLGSVVVNSPGVAVADPTDLAVISERKTRAFDPAPGAFVTFRGKRLKIWRTKVEPGRGDVGTFVDGALQTTDGRLRFLEVQPEGKRRMSGEEFARGYRPEDGEAIS